MDKIIVVLSLFFITSCENSGENSADENPKVKDTSAENEVHEEIVSERPLHNWQLLDTADRKNIFEDTVPVFLEEFARKNEFSCPDTATGCAACGYCAYIKLSDDWSYFAYERQETKHYCEIRIFGKARSGIIPLDTLYGTVINARPSKGNRMYQLTLLEAYWQDERPMSIEFYRFEKGKFILKDTITGKW